MEIVIRIQKYQLHCQAIVHMDVFFFNFICKLIIAEIQYRNKIKFSAQTESKLDKLGLIQIY